MGEGWAMSGRPLIVTLKGAVVDRLFTKYLILCFRGAEAALITRKFAGSFFSPISAGGLYVEICGLGPGF